MSLEGQGWGKGGVNTPTLITHASWEHRLFSSRKPLRHSLSHAMLSIQLKKFNTVSVVY